MKTLQRLLTLIHKLANQLNKCKVPNCIHCSGEWKRKQDWFQQVDRRKQPRDTN